MALYLPGGDWINSTDGILVFKEIRNLKKKEAEFLLGSLERKDLRSFCGL
jgi:hypothetical protein